MRLPAWLAPLTAAAESATTRTRCQRLRFVHGQAPPIPLMPIELGDRALGAVGIAHLDEGETPRLTSGSVAHDRDSVHLTGSFEQGLQIRFGGLVREVPDVQFRIHIFSCILPMQLI